jgi:hypothetical protein
MMAGPSARNMTLQLGEWEEKGFGLIGMSMKEILMMHNVVLLVQKKNKWDFRCLQLRKRFQNI